MSDNMQNERMRLVNQAGGTEPLPKRSLGKEVQAFNDELNRLLNKYAEVIPPYIVGGILMQGVISPVVVGVVGAMQRGLPEEDTQQEETGNTAG